MAHDSGLLHDRGMSLGARLVCAAVVVFPGLDLSTNARLGFSCARETESLAVTPATPPKPTTASVAIAPPPPVKPAPPPPETPATWLAKQVPDGGKVVNDGPNLSVQHTAKEGETLLQLSAKYIDLTDFFSEGQLLHALEKQNPKARGKLAAGTTLTIPGIVQAIPKTGAEARLGWPKEDGGSLRGIYANAWMAGLPTFPALLDQVAQKGMNALVLDAKDVTGQFTYPSKIPLAVEIGASKHATLPSFARVVRFAHARGIRVVARVSCFRDEWLGPRKGELAVQKKGGGPHVAPSKIVDWLDPTNEKVQQYLLDVIDESLEAGVDEIQLDYVRYPTEGVWDADFHLKEKGTTAREVITAFVKRVHEHTQKHQVPLSRAGHGVDGPGHPHARAVRRGALADGLPLALRGRVPGLREARRSPRHRRDRHPQSRRGGGGHRRQDGDPPLGPGLPLPHHLVRHGLRPRAVGRGQEGRRRRLARLEQRRRIRRHPRGGDRPEEVNQSAERR
ncbi:MAG: hypothetical protein IPJ34_23010 [Myxococcales bacterium]|nr:hypothetical protein [Myxococcales bacterium]